MLEAIPLPDADLEAIASVLSEASIVRWMGDPATSLAHAAEAHRAGTAVQTGLRLGGEWVGRAGILPYRALPGALQTVTYLVSEYRGRGLNRLVKRLEATWALELGHRSLILSCDATNARSIAAARRLGGDVGESVEESWYPRRATRVRWSLEGIEPVGPQSVLDRVGTLEGFKAMRVGPSLLPRR